MTMGQSHPPQRWVPICECKSTLDATNWSWKFPSELKMSFQAIVPPCPRQATAPLELSSHPLIVFVKYGSSSRRELG
jgi:hypothetical protein